MGHRSDRRTTRLGRLRRDVAGNTLAMMAISLIPISALAGSAVDIARLYVVKVRLQQACDAGVLAGRKFMIDSTATALDATAKKRAEDFFKNNFVEGWMLTKAVDFKPTKTTNNRVAGTAETTVPMTVMKMFAAPDVTLNTTCEARFDVADTDVMFVLDTTGSMACAPGDDSSTCTDYVGDADKKEYTRPANSATNVMPGYAGTKGWYPEEKSNSRIAALRSAVVKFWDEMDKNIQSTTQVRYGFVTYTSSVNAGAAIKAVSPASLAGANGNETSSYQTRRIVDDYDVSTESKDVTSSKKDQAACTLAETRSPATALTYVEASGTATFTTRVWKDKKCTETVRTVGPRWRYENWPVEVSGYVGGGEIKDPTDVRGSKTVWLGCIEELDASRSGQKTFSTSSLPPSMNPDFIPSSTEKWRPLWPDVTYQRTAIGYYWWGDAFRYNTTSAITLNTSEQDTNTAPNMGTTARAQSGNVSCGKPVQRLKTMTKADVEGYVKAADFRPLGGTYHDTGMLWGLRLLSRNGVFANDNKAQNGRGLPKRVIVFLTDGDMAPSPSLYGLYGMEFWDRRVANGDTDDLKDYHNKRFAALCQKAEEMDIDVWTVSITTDTTPTTEMTNCASSGDQAFAVSSADDLSNKFIKIAQAVARLRLSQ